MAPQWQCVCGDYLAADRTRCPKSGCGGVRPRLPRGAGQSVHQPWQLRQPPVRGKWADSPPSNQRGHQGKVFGGGGGSGKGPVGTTLSPEQVKTWAAFEQETWEATRLTLSKSSRDKVEAARRATALGLVGKSAPQKVDGLARQLADTQDRLQRESEVARKALEQVHKTKEAITQLQQDLAEAKREAAALYGGGISPEAIKQKLSTLNTDGISGHDLLERLSAIVSELAAEAKATRPQGQAPDAATAAAGEPPAGAPPGGGAPAAEPAAAPEAAAAAEGANGFEAFLGAEDPGGLLGGCGDDDEQRKRIRDALDVLRDAKKPRTSG